MINICKYQIIVLHLYQQKQTVKLNNMKKSFNTESLIIPGFILIILGFITLLALYPSKTEKVIDKKFVGIDAVGAKHGAGVKSTIKYH